jgi:protein TonB
MYASSNLRPRERAGAIAAVVAIHVALALAFLNLSGKLDKRDLQEAMQVFDVREVPPPEPPVIEKPEPEQAKTKEGAAAPKNIESQASPVVAPKPKIILPVQNPVVAAPIPKQGPDPSQGAAPVPGPGTGAGGAGTGTGSGGSGSGPGGGGGGGSESGVRLVRGITNRDYPGVIQRNWPPGGQIFVRLRVEPDGRISKCDIMRSFGDPAADQWTCPLLMRRAQLRPATDDNGRPIAAWFGYVQRP